MKPPTAWRIAYGLLTIGFLLTAALNLLHVRGGFLTNHAADLFVPAWLYIVLRGLAGARTTANPVSRWLGASPERAATGLFVASALSEVSQVYWPRGLFAGTFDPLDIAAYACGLLVCYVFDKRAPPSAGRRSLPA